MCSLPTNQTLDIPLSTLNSKCRLAHQLSPLELVAVHLSHAYITNSHSFKTSYDLCHSAVISQPVGSFPLLELSTITTVYCGLLSLNNSSFYALVLPMGVGYQWCLLSPHSHQLVPLFTSIMWSECPPFCLCTALSH